MAAFAKGGPDPAHSAAFRKNIQATIAAMTGVVDKPVTAC